MITLKEVLRLIENELNRTSKYIYTRLGFKQTTYSAWHTGRTKIAPDSFGEKIKTEFGIDLYRSQQNGEIVIINREKFLSHQKRGPLRMKKENTLGRPMNKERDNIYG